MIRYEDTQEGSWESVEGQYMMREKKEEAEGYKKREERTSY